MPFLLGAITAQLAAVVPEYNVLLYDFELQSASQWTERPAALNTSADAARSNSFSGVQSNTCPAHAPAAASVRAVADLDLMGSRATLFVDQGDIERVWHPGATAFTSQRKHTSRR